MPARSSPRTSWRWRPSRPTCASSCQRESLSRAGESRSTGCGCAGRPHLATRAAFLIEEACRTELPESERLVLIRRLRAGPARRLADAEERAGGDPPRL